MADPAQHQHAVEGAPVQGAVYQPQRAVHTAVAAAEWSSQPQQQQQPQQPQGVTGDWSQQGGMQQQQQQQQQGEWQTHYSEGRAYYYNTTTGETRWA